MRFFLGKRAVALGEDGGGGERLEEAFGDGGAGALGGGPDGVGHRRFGDGRGGLRRFVVDFCHCYGWFFEIFVDLVTHFGVLS